MKKYLSILSAFLIMICIGGVYAWSIFVPMLKAQLLYTTAQTQIIVGLTFGIFALSMIFAGKFLKRFGPAKTATIGVVSLVLGYFIAFFSNGEMILLSIGIGILCGIGTGFCYVCCLVVPAQNFPQNKGMATGIAVGGFGAGAILLSYIVKLVLSYYPETTVLELFRLIGIVYGIIISISILFLKLITPSIQVANEEKRQAFSFTEAHFIILFLTMFCGTFAGLLIVGNAKPIAISLGFNENTATLSVTLLAIGNMSGRVFWGWTLDKIGVNKTLLIAYSILLSAVLAFNLISDSELLLNAILLLIGLGFSSNFVMFAAKTTQIYGIDRLGNIYPYIFLAYGIAGVIGPFVGGWLFDIHKSYTLALIISSILTFVGLILYQIYFIYHDKNKPV